MTTTLNSQPSSLNQFDWQRARDVLSGEDSIKDAGTKYLPRLDSQSGAEYEAYKTRASFLGATSRTLEEYLDLLFRRPPQLKVSEPLQRSLTTAEPWGESFEFRSPWCHRRFPRILRRSHPIHRTRARSRRASPGPSRR